MEENNYYPFGLKHKGYNNVITGRDHKYGFGGKEYNDELGLDWYDVSARNYDPALGRWMNLDPLAEKMRRHSPYNFGFDNPVFFQDYDGMMPTGGTDPIKKAKAVAQKAETAVIDSLESAGNSIAGAFNSAINYAFGGADLRSDVSKGTGDQSTKRQGTRDTETVDVTGFDIASGTAKTGPGKSKNNNKGTSNNTNRTKGTKDGKKFGKKTMISVVQKAVSNSKKIATLYKGSMNTETTAGESGTGMVSVKLTKSETVTVNQAYGAISVSGTSTVKDTLVNPTDVGNVIRVNDSINSSKRDEAFKRFNAGK